MSLRGPTPAARPSIHTARIGPRLGGSGRRQSTVAALARNDLSEDQIARELGISAHTVHTHFERVYRKLGVRSRCQLIVSLFRAYSRLPAAPSGERAGASLRCTSQTTVSE
jgi:DNA-binding CsgD family transcriptional regulator